MVKTSMSRPVRNNPAVVEDFQLRHHHPAWLRIMLERILMLYDEAEQALKRASSAILACQEEVKAESLSKALAVLMELRAGLDHSLSPELTRNLEDLYTYSINRIFAANCLNDSEAISQALKVLDILRAAWEEIRLTLDKS